MLCQPGAGFVHGQELSTQARIGVAGRTRGEATTAAKAVELGPWSLCFAQGVPVQAGLGGGQTGFPSVCRGKQRLLPITIHLAATNI